MTRSISWLLPLIAGLFCPTIATAGPVFSYAFDQSGYNVAVGDTVDVTVYLQEVDTFSLGSLPNGYLATTGLFGAGVLLNYSAQPAVVLPAPNVAPSAEFLTDPTSAASVTVTSSNAVLVENVGLGILVTAAGAGPVYEVELGDFEFTGILTGTATISATVTGSGGDLVGGDGSLLDQLTGSATTEIIVGSGAFIAPEPSSLGMLIVGSVTALAVMRRKRHSC
jgi:hypothetical protein